MLKMIGIIIVISFTSLIGLSQKESSQKLSPFKLSNKCGYINQEGKIRVLPQFEFCDVLNEDLAGVSISKKYGYIDKTGQIVIPLKLEEIFH